MVTGLGLKRSHFPLKRSVPLGRFICEKFEGYVMKYKLCIASGAPVGRLVSACHNNITCFVAQCAMQSVAVRI